MTGQTNRQIVYMNWVYFVVCFVSFIQVLRNIAKVSPNFVNMAKPDPDGSVEQMMREKISQLERDLEKSQSNFEHEVRKGNERPLFVGRDKKIKSFSMKDDVDEWYENIVHFIEQRFKSESDQKEFVLDHIDKEPKLELKLHLDLSKAKTSEILTQLKEIFGPKDTVVQLQQQFFGRNKSSSESLEDYAFVLMNIAANLQKLNHREFSNIEEVLKQKFAEGVSDISLKRELRRLNTECKGLKFWELRDRAKSWVVCDVADTSQESVKLSGSSAVAQSSIAIGAGDVTNKLIQLLEKHDKAIDDLKQSVLESNTGQHNHQFGRGRGRRRGGRGRGRGNPRSFSGGSNRQSDDGTAAEENKEDQGNSFSCFYCKGPNHMQRDCLKKKSDQRSKAGQTWQNEQSTHDPSN